MRISGVRFGGIVLCGGRSRRMQTDKVWLRAGGEYWLQRMVRLVGEIVGPVVVASRCEQKLPPLPDGVEVVCDAVADIGPLAGMDSGLSALAPDCGAAFVVSCDHPLLEPKLVRFLCEQLAGYDAVIPVHEGRMHPLAAVYDLRVRVTIAEHIARADYRVTNLLDHLQVRRVDTSELRTVDSDLRSLINVNDPEQLARAQVQFGLDPTSTT